MVSATAEIMYTTQMGNRGSQFHDRKDRPMLAPVPRVWLSTMSVRFMLPVTMMTTRKQKPMAIS